VTNSTNLDLYRQGVSSVEPTVGELQVEGVHFCWTLELPWLNNLAGKSCIPTGTYRVEFVLSTRFKRDMPRLLDVPDRAGILIHPGNVEADTEGCILLGDTRSGDCVLESRPAFDRFLQWFASVGNTAQISIWNSTPVYEEWNPSAP
jgi:hypothetical protein